MSKPVMYLYDRNHDQTSQEGELIKRRGEGLECPVVMPPEPDEKVPYKGDMTLSEI